MKTALTLFAVQGALGAFDTLYYHEWRARLPALRGARVELTLHATRDLLYAVLFGALPFLRFEGLAAWGLGALLVAEIAITLTDFVVEDAVRRPLGGVYPGERVMHAVMGIVYGAALGYLVPELIAGAARPTGLVPWAAPDWQRVVLPLFAVGVFASGLRDYAAAFGPRWCALPWRRS